VLPNFLLQRANVREISVLGSAIEMHERGRISSSVSGLVAANIEYNHLKSQAGLSTTQLESFNLISKFNRPRISAATFLQRQ
jgi:hypothetical protein